MKRDTIFCALALLLPALLLASGCSRPRSDAQMASEVHRQVYSDPGIHTRQVTIESHNGIVTLDGSVASDPERFAAAADAANVDGVRTVVNNLQVVPPQAQVSAPQPSSPTPTSPVPAAPTESPAQPAPYTEQRASLASASPVNQMPRRRKSEASAGRLHTAKSKMKESGSKLAAANRTGGSGLPYSVSAPPSSPIGASDTPANPGTPAITSQPTQTSVPEPAVVSSSAVPPAAAPALKAAPAPVTAALPAAPPQPVSIPSGTAISVRLLDRIDTATGHPGDSFRATLNSPLVDESGATVVPKGAEVTGKIVNLKSAGRFAGSSELALQLTQLSVHGKQYSLQTNQYTRKGKARGKSTAEKVGGGAALGAILGGIFGGAKGAAIGATVGAGAGTGVSATGRGQQIVLRPETALNFELESALSVVPAAQLSHSPGTEQGSTATGEHSADAGDGPPVLKRRSH